MVKLKLSIFFMLLVFSVMAHAWVDRDGKQVADSENRKSVADFGAWLLLVDDEDAFFKVWETTTSTVNINTADRVERNKQIVLLIIFSGCKVDTKGNCKLVADFTITQPDGKQYASIPNQPLWLNKPAPPAAKLVMGEAYLRIRIEPHEQLGAYKVQAVIKDLNNNATLDLSSTFTSYEN